MRLRKPPTNVQPLRAILGQPYRENHSWWVELDCGHVEPANGLPDSATSLRCRECLPVRALPGPDAEPGRGA